MVYRQRAQCPERNSKGAKLIAELIMDLLISRRPVKVQVRTRRAISPVSRMLG